MSRLEQIQQLLNRDPSDVFLNFSLAMELAAAGRKDDALGQFDKVVSLNPDYATAYFRKGDLLAERGRLDEARDTLQAGIEAARRTGDNHLVMKMTDRLAQLA